MSHFINKCSCGEIISQCRCIDKNKTVTIIKNGCEKCKSGIKPMKQQWEEKLTDILYNVWCGGSSDDAWEQIAKIIDSEREKAKAERTEEIFLKCRQDAEKELVAIQSIIKPDSFRNEDDCFDTLVEVSEKITNLVLKLRSLHLKESES